MLSRRPCFHGFSRTLSYSSLYCFVEKTVNGMGKKCSFTVTILRQCKLLKNGRSKEPLIMEYMRRLIMCAMLNNFAIFSDEICYE